MTKKERIEQLEGDVERLQKSLDIAWRSIRYLESGRATGYNPWAQIGATCRTCGAGGPHNCMGGYAISSVTYTPFSETEAAS